MKNGEGYSAPTESEAIRRASFLPDHVWNVINVLKAACGLVKFRIKYIVLEDTDTGKEYTWGD